MVFNEESINRMATPIKFDYHASFSRVVPLLQITFEPTYYLELVEARLRERSILEDNHPYWQKVPVYLIARCPLCGAPYERAIDTHGLYKWLFSSELYRDPFWNQQQADVTHFLLRRFDAKKKKKHSVSKPTTGCAHIVGTQIFLNINGNMPREMDYLVNDWGDVPVITPEIFSHPMQSAAMMHSLPICRLENNQFIPKYSAYFLTYYAEDAKAMEKYAINEMHHPDQRKDKDEWHGGFPPFWPSWRINKEPMVADLGSWVEKKKLYWLDLDDPDLPLRTGTKERFPYAGIKGYGTSWTYRKEPEPWWFWKRRRWTPDGIIRNTYRKQLN